MKFAHQWSFSTVLLKFSYEKATIIYWVGKHKKRTHCELNNLLYWLSFAKNLHMQTRPTYFSCTFCFYWLSFVEFTLFLHSLKVWSYVAQRKIFPLLWTFKKSLIEVAILICAYISFLVKSQYHSQKSSLLSHAWLPYHFYLSFFDDISIHFFATLLSLVISSHVAF